MAGGAHRGQQGGAQQGEGAGGVGVAQPQVSSRPTASRSQWMLFSTVQCPRTSRAIWRGEASPGADEVAAVFGAGIGHGAQGFCEGLEFLGGEGQRRAFADGLAGGVLGGKGFGAEALADDVDEAVPHRFEAAEEVLGLRPTGGGSFVIG